MENRDPDERARTGRNQRLNRELRRIHYRGNPASGPVPVEEMERRSLTPSPTAPPPPPQQEAGNEDRQKLPELDQGNIKAFYKNSLSQKSGRKSEEQSGLCFDESSSEDGEMDVIAVSSRNTSADDTHGQDRSASDLRPSDSSDRKTLLTVTDVSITEASSSGTASASAADDSSGLASTYTTEDTYATAVTSANEGTSFGTSATSATEATFATAATSVAEEAATAPPESSAAHRLPLRKRIRRTTGTPIHRLFSGTNPGINFTMPTDLDLDCDGIRFITASVCMCVVGMGSGVLTD